mgnify:FL=1
MAVRKKPTTLEPEARKIIRMGPCQQARRWLLSLPSGTSPEEAWMACPSGPWAMWLLAGLADRLALNRMFPVLGACAAASVDQVTSDEAKLLELVRRGALCCVSNPSADVTDVTSAWKAASRSIAEGRAKHAVLSMMTNHDVVLSCMADLDRCEAKHRDRYAERLRLAVSWGTTFACAAASDWRTDAMDEAAAREIRSAVPWSAVEAALASLPWEAS